MTDEEKVKMVRTECLKRAEQASGAQRASLILYADILGPLVAWEASAATKDLSLNEYMLAVIGICASLATHCVTNIDSQESGMIDQLGPMFTAKFAQVFQYEVMNTEIGAVLGSRSAH